MARWMQRDKMLPLLLDNVYGLRSQQEIADLSGYSVQRISQFVTEMIEASPATRHNYREQPGVVSAHVCRTDLRNRVWDNTPASFYYYERGLTPKEEF